MCDVGSSPCSQLRLTGEVAASTKFGIGVRATKTKQRPKLGRFAIACNRNLSE